MNDQHVSDRDLNAAFAARAAGAPSPDIYDRISAETARTKQSRPLLVLPGFASGATTRLVWAVVLAALTIAVVGVLAFGAGRNDLAVVDPTASPATSDPPIASPSADPSGAPSPSVAPPPSSAQPSASSVEPSASPSGDPTPSPFVPPELVRDDIGRVVATDGLRVRSLPAVGEESERLEPTLEEGTPFYVVDGPVHADGYAWYQVDPYGGDPALTPFGWVAAGSREGEPWIENLLDGCDSMGVSVELLATNEPQENLYCYGVQMPADYELTGTLVCDFGDVEGLASGPEWVQFDRFCTLQAPDSTVEGGVSLRVWGTAATSLLDEGSPVEGEYTVVGHLDDPGADECVSANPDEDPAETRLFCRMQFVVTDVRPAG